MNYDPSNLRTAGVVRGAALQEIASPGANLTRALPGLSASRSSVYRTRAKRRDLLWVELNWLVGHLRAWDKKILQLERSHLPIARAAT